MLLTMDPQDNEAIQKGEVTEDVARKAIEKAMTEATKFNSTFNEIPVFMIQQMRMQKQPAEGEAASNIDPSQLETILPMYFNLQNMVSLWQRFTSQSPEAKGVEPAINLMDLFELVAKLQEESEVDFRNVVLVPATPMGGAQTSEQAAAASASAPSGDDPFKMPGDTTLGDL